MLQHHGEKGQEIYRLKEREGEIIFFEKLFFKENLIPEMINFPSYNMLTHSRMTTV